MGLFYNKNDIDSLLNGKADIGHTHPEVGANFAETVQNATAKLLEMQTGSADVQFVKNDTTGAWTITANKFRGSIEGGDVKLQGTYDDAAYLRGFNDDFLVELGTDQNAVIGAFNGNPTILPLITVLVGGTSTNVDCSINGKISVQNCSTTEFRVPGSFFPVGNSDKVVGTGMSRAFSSENQYLVMNKGGDFNKVTLGGNVVCQSIDIVSKRELKEHIQSFQESALSILEKVELFKFRYKGSNVDRVGIIAEETNQILSGESKDRFDIANATGLLIKAVQELITTQESIEEMVRGGAVCQ